MRYLENEYKNQLPTTTGNETPANRALILSIAGVMAVASFGLDYVADGLRSIASFITGS